MTTTEKTTSGICPPLKITLLIIHIAFCSISGPLKKNVISNGHYTNSGNITDILSLNLLPDNTHKTAALRKSVPENNRDTFNNNLYIDPGNITDTLLPILLLDDTNKTASFEMAVSKNDADNMAIENYFDIIFRYRDKALLPCFYKIISSNAVHPYFKISSIYAIGETGNRNDAEKLAGIWQREKNDLTREYIASAIGKLADSTSIPRITQMLKTEPNAYVRKTLKASIDRAEGKRQVNITYLPLSDSTRFRRLKTFPSESPDPDFGLIAREKIDADMYQYIPLADACVYPHMQYKACRSIYDKVKQPFKSFALPGVSHVGEDSGWLFEGMPVHSIMRGRVALIQHEESWGCLVCIESMLSDFSTVCSYYGHLSSDLDVYIGKIVETGDKIGEIGPSFTFQNGGYRAHLHLGIEKASIKNALIAGYHDDVDRWYNPMEFIQEPGSD